MVDTYTKNVSSTGAIVKAIDTKKNLYRFSWNQVFRQLKTNLTDPKLRGENFIYGQYPEAIIGDESNLTEETIKTDYPLVVIQNSKLTEFENQTLDYETSEMSIDINIEIFSERNDYLDRLSDDILFILYNNVQTNAEAGMHNMKIINDSYNPYERNGVNIHNRLFTVRFNVTRG